MRRIVQYLVLAAVLVGLPLGCAWIGGYDEVLADVAKIAPQCERWVDDPTRLWSVKCPFCWWVFATMGVFVAAVVGPFVRRFIKACFHCSPSPSTFTFPWWGWAGVAVMLAGWVLAWTRFGWFATFQRYTYIPQWAGFIVTVNALCMRRCGRSPLADRTKPYLLLFPASSLFWWFFEYLNRYVWNWFYVGTVDNVSEAIPPLKYIVISSINFASVLPGVTAVAALLGTFRAFDERAYAGMAKVNIRSGVSVVTLAALTLLGLAGIVFFPSFAYPLLWISPLMGFVLVQMMFKEKCVLDVLATGNWAIVFRFACAALVCGLVWETWNYYSLAKWIYNVPWVSRWHVWKMPILGFAGYLPFGMECAAIAHWISPKLVEPDFRR